MRAPRGREGLVGVVEGVYSVTASLCRFSLLRALEGAASRAIRANAEICPARLGERDVVIAQRRGIGTALQGVRVREGYRSWYSGGREGTSTRGQSIPRRLLSCNVRWWSAQKSETQE